MRVLGIETSCDETGVAVYDGADGLIADLLYSQVKTHAEFGGVVPEMASRDHIRKTLPMIREALDSLDPATGGTPPVSAVAYTRGPGLVGALMVGASLAKSLALAWNIPAIGVHHMEGHLLAALLGDDKPAWPFVALLVSGGHTMLVEASDIGDYRILGESRDDAAGEAFDKAAKMLGLGYPGGPEIARIASTGSADRFTFPRPMVDRPGLEFSFSGLKTYTMNTITAIAADGSLTDQDRADVARAFEDAVADTITIKCRRALEETGLTSLVIAGGVSANRTLRGKLEAMTHRLGARLYCPPLSLCTDNGAMIAYAGYERLQRGHKETLAIDVRPRWPMTEIGLDS